MEHHRKIFFYLLGATLFLSSLVVPFRQVFADKLLDILIRNDDLYIPSCASQLPLGAMHYTAYLNGIDVFSTGPFGGFPCGIGNDLFSPRISDFVTVYSESTTSPGHLVFNFYKTSPFGLELFAHFHVYYDGHVSTPFNDSTHIGSFDVSTSTQSVTVHDYISLSDVGSDITFTISTSSQNILYTNTVQATTTGDFYHTWKYQDLPGGADYTFYTDIASSTGVVMSTSTTVSMPETGCVTDCFSSVLFIPGLEASRLYAEKGVTCQINCEDQLWEPNSNSDVEDLYMNTDGTSKKGDVYTKDIISETNTPFPAGFLGQNIYKSFSTMMDGLVTDQKIHEWRAFPYDWRMSVEDVVTVPQKTKDGGHVSLVETLQALVDSSKNHKVTIVAHSNGGLVAKELMIKLQEMKDGGVNDLIDHVDVLMFVAVPQIGTASAIPAILHGYDQEKLGGLLVSMVRARELARNMSGAYGLLPSQEYVNHIDIAPVTFSDTLVPSGVTTPYVSRYGATIDSYSEYLDFLFGAEGRSAPAVADTLLPITLSQSIYAQAEALHGKIDTWVPPSGLRVITVAGWGLDTVAGFTYKPSETCVSTGVGVCQRTLDERPVFTVNGDRTVVGPSAQYGGGEKVWVDLKEYNRFRPGPLGSNHSSILEVSQLNSSVKSILLNEQIAYDSVLKTMMPTDSTNRLHISIHSPVSIGAYDSNGNFTGKVCPQTSDFCYVQKDIPNSSYLEFGEGKYINLPEENMKKVSLQGTGVGTFTFEVEKVLPSGQSTTTAFMDIPVTPQTSGEYSLNTVSGNPELKLDVTGDGVPDFTIAPTKEFDPILYLQIMKKTLETLTLSPLSRLLITIQIDTTIQALKKGKINKAKLKIDFFKQVLSFRLKLPDQARQNPKILSKEDSEKLIAMLNQLLINLNK